MFMFTFFTSEYKTGFSSATTDFMLFVLIYLNVFIMGGTAFCAFYLKCIFIRMFGVSEGSKPVTLDSSADAFNKNLTIVVFR